ncbi:MAG: hypothetical protein ACOWWH_06085 [Eubacteriaceae bacterium]
MKKIYLVLVICILISTTMMGCNSNKEEDDENKSESKVMPSSLEQIQQLSDEIITATMTKEWAVGLDKSRELQKTWNVLYPELQKNGVAKENVDGFVEDINLLTDYLMVQTLKLPESKASNESQGDSTEQDNKEEDDSSKEQEESSNTENSETKSSDEEKLEESDPKKILGKIDPINSATKEELIIINSAVEVTKYLPRFMSLFESPVPTGIFKIKYYAHHLNISTKMEKWDFVSEDISSIIEIWNSLKMTESELDEEAKVQLTQNIKELKDVVDSKNSNLIGMKSTIIIEYIEELIKNINEKQSK